MRMFQRWQIVVWVALVLATAQVEADPQRDRRWQEDLRYLATELPKRHVKPFRVASLETFEAAANKLLAEIPQLEDHQIVVRMAQLVALIGDAQTRLNPAEHAYKAHYVPIGFFWFNDGLRVTAARQADLHLLGARLERIGGMAIDEVVAKAGTVVGQENELVLKRAAPLLINNVEVLHGVGIIAGLDAVEYTLTLRDGTEKVVRFEAMPMQDRARYVEPTDLPGVEPPLYLRAVREQYWMKYLDEARALYVQYNDPREKKERPFTAFVEELFRLVDEKSPERLIIDVRHNDGTNSTVANPLIQRIQGDERFRERGRLFVIIGRETSSAGMMNAMQLGGLCGAILVGEATGGRPNNYGEIQATTLPNSGYTVTYTTHFWEVRPGDIKATLRPDVLAEPTYEALAAGRDPALEACLSWKKP